MASIALLQGIQTPPPEAGGGTSFVNLAGAYAALDDATKSEIEGMQVLRRHKAFFNDPNPEFFQTEQAHSVISPLVRRAPLSGKPTLYDIGDRWWVSIVGLSRPKSDALRRRLFEHSTQERFKYAHRWQPGDLIIWDNISTMHRRDEFDNSYTRICRVLDVMEEVPSGKSPVHAASQERPLSV